MLWRTKSHHSQASEQEKNDPAASATAAAGTAWLAGHLHHLTPEQEASLEEFKKYCAEQGYYTPAEGQEKPPSHDDATMLYVKPRRIVKRDMLTGYFLQSVFKSPEVRCPGCVGSIQGDRGLAQGECY